MAQLTPLRSPMAAAAVIAHPGFHFNCITVQPDSYPSSLPHLPTSPPPSPQLGWSVVNQAPNPLGSRSGTFSLLRGNPVWELIQPPGNRTRVASKEA